MTPTLSLKQSPALAQSTSSSGRKALWTGRILSGLGFLFMLFDAGGKLLKPDAVVKGTMALGYPEQTITLMGVLLVICLVLFAVPRTSVLGALLFTGYLGGAVASNVRVGNPLFSHDLFPVYVATFLWLGLWLRDARVRAVLPLRRG